MPKSLILGVLALVALVGMACGGPAPTPLPEDTATAVPTPDLPATVAAEVEAIIAARADVAPTATPTPEPQAPPATPTATPLPPIVAATPTFPQLTTPALILTASVAAVELVPLSASLEEGETRQLESVVIDRPGNPLTGRPVAWSSSNSAVAQVSATGLVTGVSAGVASVTATVEGVGAVAGIEVRHGPVASVEIALGGGAQLVAILKDGLGHLLQDRTVTWSSSDPGVLQVDPVSGALAAGAQGTVTINAISEGVSAAASLQVSNEPVALMEVAPEMVSVEMGEAVQLSAAPQSAAGQLLSGRTVNWSSSDPGVAQVSASGVLTGVSVGASTITATAEGIEATAAVTVTPVSVFLVALSSDTSSVQEGETAQLSAEAHDAEGQDLTGRAVTWSSSDPGVAQVSATGVVTGVAAGTAAITATVEGVSDTATMEVSHGPVASVEIGLGAGNQLVAALRDDSSHLLEDRTVAWTSSDPAVVGVEAQTGQLTVGAVGVATVTATAEGVTASASITVNPEPVASVSVTPGEAALEAGSSVQLAAAPKDGGGNLLTGRTVSWTSAPEGTATVSDTGLVTGVTPGTAVITATVDGVSGTAKVAVSPQSVLAYSLLWSESSNRSNPAPLEDANVSGTIYVFTNPDQGVDGVSFYVDDPNRQGSPYRSEGADPYDLGGTQGNGTAGGYDTAQLSNVDHTIDAQITLTDGRTVVVKATFKVENQVAPPPLPTAKYSLLWSVSPDRSNPAPLDDASVSVNIYVFTDPDLGVDRVRFYLNDPDRQGNPHRTENAAPYDLAGTRNNDNANRTDTSLLGTGPHTVTAQITRTDGSNVTVTATFMVETAQADSPPIPPESYSLLWSASSNRSNPTSLEGATVTGNIYVFTDPDQGVAGVTFYLDDTPSLTSPYRSEGAAPYDLAGTRSNRDANGYDAGQLGSGPGPHNITAVIVLTDGSAVTVGANFLVGLAFKSLSSGWSHTCGVTDDGEAYCWGNGFRGQLGNGSTLDAMGPIPVDGGLIFRSVSAGKNHACGVVVEGDAYCWGEGVSGELGHDFGETSLIPVRVHTEYQDGFSFSSVSAGASHTCGVSDDNKAYCWGLGDIGQLGIGSSGTVDLPVPVSGGHAFLSVSAGDGYTCGVTTGGEAYCWGAGEFGQLGSGQVGPDYLEYEPVLVKGNHNFLSVSAGTTHTCGVTTQGDAYCWGNGDTGELGTGEDGTGYRETEPALVLGEHAFESVSTGRRHTCGVTIDNAAYCWGSGDRGELGNGQDGELYHENEPVPVSGNHKFASVSLGFEHTCGFTPEGASYCWGDSGSGQVGNGFTSFREKPEPVSPPLTFKSVSAGGNLTCGTTTQLGTYCWGEGDNGRRSGSQKRPVPVVGERSYVSMTNGRIHACGVTAGGDVYCWGAGGNGRLGNGSEESQIIPALVPSSLDFASVSAGGSHTCAITDQGKIYCWGANNTGQLGNNSQTSQSTPALVSGEQTFISVTSGASHTCAITTEGQAYCWGLGFSGQLGDGSLGIRLTPELVLGGYRYNWLSAGGNTTCGTVLPSNSIFPNPDIVGGQAYCWGDGFNGKLGDGVSTFGYKTTTPGFVFGEHTFIAISVGGGHTCGITDQADAYCWGLGDTGQLGNDSRDSQAAPGRVTGGLEFREVTAGANHTCGVTIQNIAYCWGDYRRGQMGSSGGFPLGLNPGHVANLE